MDILEKLSAVAVNVDDRISEADRLWCETQETAYHAGVSALSQLCELTDRFWNEQLELLSPCGNSFVTYLGTSSDYDNSRFFQEREYIHERFVRCLVNHFAEVYHITLDAERAVDSLIPKKPARSSASSEIIAYAKRMNDFLLNHRQVVEHIFTQLGGLSFSDVAVREIVQGAHRAAWCRGKPEYEQKKAVVVFSDGCYSYGWDDSHFRFNDGMQRILKAASHFENGMTVALVNRIETMLHGIYGTTFEIGTKKLDSVRCFKNGRVDLRFTSETFAREFIEQYLGTEAA